MKEVKTYNPLVIIGEEAIVNYNVHQYIVNENLKDIKRLWSVFTPEWVIDFMVDLINVEKYIDNNNIMILEPACGLAQFLSGIKRKSLHFLTKLIFSEWKSIKILLII